MRYLSIASILPRVDRKHQTGGSAQTQAIHYCGRGSNKQKTSHNKPKKINMKNEVYAIFRIFSLFDRKLKSINLHLNSTRLPSQKQ